MQCPACKTTTLVMAERQGIEIDYCPQCRGVWLDRGELDKLIERSAAQLEAQQPTAAPPPSAAAPQYPPAQYPPPQYPPRQHGHDPYRGHPQHPKHGYPHKKRKGFLGELFDFD